MTTGFKVQLNREHLVTIAADNLSTLAVHVMGGCIRPELANCEVSGGLYNEGPENISLSWTPDLELKSGDELSITFVDNASISHPGKTNDERYPDGPTEEDCSLSTEGRLDKLEKAARSRDGFQLHLTAPNGDQLEICSIDDSYSFSFGIHWDWTRPEQARVTLRTYPIRWLKDNTGSTDHARFEIAFGDQVAFRVSER